jgi:hypothetical protein
MFFYFEQVNKEISDIIESFFGTNNSEEESENDLADADNEGEQAFRQGSVLDDLKQEVEARFKARWGFIDLAVQVAKETNTSYFTVMDKPAIAVISLAAYLQDKVELIESRTKK